MNAPNHGVPLETEDRVRPESLNRCEYAHAALVASPRAMTFHTPKTMTFRRAPCVYHCVGFRANGKGAARRCALRCRQRSCGHEFLAARINRQIEPFQTARAEQKEIPFFGEYHLVDGKGLLYPDNGEADTACNALAIGHHEFHILLLSRDADSFQSRGRQPGVFTAGIDENARDGCALCAMHGILYPATYGKSAHVQTSMLVKCEDAIDFTPLGWNRHTSSGLKAFGLLIEQTASSNPVIADKVIE